MPNELDPLVDEWYAHLDKGQRFFVTAVDDDHDCIEIQNFDGTIEEISMEEWRDLYIELSVEPENWTGALDIGEKDDLGTGVTDTRGGDWSEPGEIYRRSDE